MKIAPLADVKARLSAYIQECESDGPIVITRNGKPVAVLLAPEDEDDLERLILGHSPRFQAFLENSWKKIREGKGLPSQTFWREVARRAQQRTARNRKQAAAGAGSGKKQK